MSQGKDNAMIPFAIAAAIFTFIIGFIVGVHITLSLCDVEGEHQ